MKVFLTMTFVLCSSCAVFGVEVINQSTMALQPYNTSAYQIVMNANTTHSISGSGSYTDSTEMASTSGKDMKFQSLLYTGISNPQSITVSPDGDTAWIMSSYKSGSDNARRGHIYKVDLSRYWEKDAAGDENTDAVTEGPEITTGHGQTLAYNPKKNELWYVRETKVLNTTLVQVDPDTLEVVKEIHFRFGSTIVFPPTFCFDRDGNCWTYTRSAGSNWVSRGTIRFYKGTIEDDYVSFEMVMQGVRYPPGDLCQTFGYDPVNDELYVVSDCSILTVPRTKLMNEQLTGDDVGSIIFGNSNREFEGIAFTEAGCCYLVTNKPSEIMRDEVSYKKAVKLKKKIDKAKKAYATDKKAMKAKKEAEVQDIVTEKIGEELHDGL